jgi:serine/threonine protein kinase
MHEYQVVHLDLKPQNVYVVLDDTGAVRARCCIMDLGLAITFPNPWKDPFILQRGTVPYKSPEVGGLE